MVLGELTTYLATQGVGTEGTDLFYGHLPETPDACVVLMEYAGLANEPDLGTGNTRLEYPKIQVMVRGVKDDQLNPRKKIQDVVTALTKVLNQTLSGISYKAVMAMQAPFLLKIDDNFRYVFVCNFLVTKAYSTT